MRITLVVCAVALLLAAFMLRMARGHRARVRDLSELEGLTQPVDVAAFRNLVDPAEEEYLRGQLARKSFRVVQRQRLRAALDYVGRTKHNGAILLRLGESLRGDSNPEIAAAGRELVEKAMRLRMTALVATGILYARIVMPEAPLSIGHVTVIYESVTDGVLRLRRIQSPAYASHVAALM